MPEFQKQYTPTEAIKVFRTVMEYLSNHPELLKQEGIFRLSGKADNQKLIEDILNDAPIPKPGILTDDYVSALKSVVKSVSLNPKEAAVREFTDKIIYLQNQMTQSNTSKEEKKIVDDSWRAISDLVRKLIATGKSENLVFAEMLNTYFHMANKVASFSDSNKMPASNMSRIVGPILGDQIPTNENANILELYNFINKVCERIIESDYSTRTFTATYMPLAIISLERKIQALQNEIQRADTKVKEIESKRKAHMDAYSNLLQTLKGKEAHITSLKTLMRDEKGKSRDEIKRNIKELENEYRELKAQSESYLNIADQATKSLKGLVKAKRNMEKELVALLSEYDLWLEREKSYLPKLPQDKDHTKREPMVFLKTKKGELQIHSETENKPPVPSRDNIPERFKRTKK